MWHEVGILLSCARLFGPPAVEAGRESKEYFSVASESESFFRLMEHKGDHVSPFETTSCGTCMQCLFQWCVHDASLYLQTIALFGSLGGMRIETVVKGALATGFVGNWSNSNISLSPVLLQ